MWMLVPCIRDVRRYHHIPDEGNAGPPPYWSLVRRTFQLLDIGTEMPNVSNEACKCSTLFLPVLELQEIWYSSVLLVR